MGKLAELELFILIPQELPLLKTYTLQSPTSVFLSPYPSVPCDANIEPQHRSIDSFYYMEKSAAYMTEMCRVIEMMSKLRKRNSRQGEVNKIEIVEEKDKKVIAKDDFEENKGENNRFNINSTTNPNINLNTNMNMNLNVNQNGNNDNELLFMTAQAIPLLDNMWRDDSRFVFALIAPSLKSD